MRYLISFITLAVVLVSAYVFVIDARSSFIVDQLKAAPPKKAKQTSHATLVPVPGQKSLFKVSFSAKAAERTGIKTQPLHEDRVTRKRTLTGTIERAPDGALQVTVPLSGRTDEPARSQSASLRRVGAQEVIATVALHDVVPKPGDDQQRIARFKLDGGGGTLAAGDRVHVDLAVGAPNDRKLIPAAAIVFDAKGGAWVYVAVDPLTFLRTAVKVDYVEGGVAYLVEGPKPGTPIATGGVVEISGAESRIGFVSVSASF